MKNRTLVCASLSVFLVGACAQEPPPVPPPPDTASSPLWETNFETAQKRAADAKRSIFAFFTGSDWCPWCDHFDREVLSAPAFQDYARDTFVLFVADYPMKKQLAPATVEQNKALQTRHRIKGFPTVLLLSGDGRVLAETGYRPGGAEAYVQHLRDLLADKPPTPSPPPPAPPAPTLP